MDKKNETSPRISEKTAVAAAAWERDAKGVQALPLVIGAAIVALVGYTLLSGGDEEAPEVAADEVADQGPEPAPAEEPATPKPDLAPEEAAETEGAVDGEGTGETGGADEAGETRGTPADEPDSAAGGKRVLAAAQPKPSGSGSSSGSKSSSGSTKPPSGSDPTSGPKPTPAPTPAPAPAENTEERIAAALEAGWMREAGGFLLVFPKNAPVSWADASRLCRRKEAGVGGWKLPSVSQLEAVRKANGLPAGTWWSSNAAGEGSALALTTSKPKADETSKEDGRALPLCVRKR